jgi:nucleoid DNA-binding protein
MDERFSLNDIARILSEKTGIELPGAGKFIDELISLINEGIRQDRLVKVRGLGVFKVLLVKERESIHVSTGERIVIPEHHKLAFIPEKEMKLLVNKPFSAFGAELISSRPLPEGGGQDEETTYLSPSPVIKETKIETPPPVEAPHPEQPKASAQQDDTVLLHIHAAEEDQTKDDTVLVPPPPPGKAETADALPERTENEDTTLVTPIRTVAAAPPPPPLPLVIKDDTVVIPKTEPPQEQEIQKTTPRKKKKPLWPLYVTLIVLLLILCGCIWFFLSDASLPFFSNNRSMAGSEVPFFMPGDTLPAPDTTVVNPPTTPDTTATPIPPPSPEKPRPSNPAPSKPTTPPATSNSKVIAKVKMTAGQRLTLLALDYYGNKIFWVYIYEYNKSKIGSNPNVIPIGMELSIPAKSVYGIDANNAASVEKARQHQTEIMSGLQQSYSYY